MFSQLRESRTTPHSQRFCPTWRGFHPPGGLSVLVFTSNAPRRPTKRCPAGLRASLLVPPGTGPARRARPRTSCPVSAASAASAPAAARRTTAARGTPATRVAAGMTARVATGMTARVAPRVTAPAVAGPPAAATRPTAAAGRPAPLAPAQRLPAASGVRHHHDEEHGPHDHRHPDEHIIHGPHALPSPEAMSPAPCRVLRARGIPPPPYGQSRLEQLQSFRAGWRS